MNSRLHIIASCSGRKRVAIPEELYLRAVGGESLRDRHRVWVERLRKSSDPRLRADALYSGDHAAVLRSAREIAYEKGHDAHIWFLSAGYGLVSESAKLHPYSATFANGEPDSVSSGREQKAEWWRFCCAQRPREAGAPNDLCSLVKSERGAIFLIVASPRYLEAIERDLAAALEHAPRANIRIISSANAAFQAKFPDHYLATSADQAGQLGGALSSLHARAARTMIEKDLLTRPLDELRRRFGEVAEGNEKKQAGKAMTDAGVTKYIESARDSDPIISATRALRELRDRGMACEQKRFGRLFAAVQQGRLFS